MELWYSEQIFLIVLLQLWLHNCAHCTFICASDNNNYSQHHHLGLQLIASYTRIALLPLLIAPHFWFMWLLISPFKQKINFMLCVYLFLIKILCHTHGSCLDVSRDCLGLNKFFGQGLSQTVLSKCDEGYKILRETDKIKVHRNRRLICVFLCYFFWNFDQFKFCPGNMP